MIYAYVNTEEIAEWKKKYWAVSTVNIADIDFVYRQLSRAEQKNIVSTYQTLLEQEEAICKACTLWPGNYNFEKGPAGIATVLTELILRESGFSDTAADTISEKITTYRLEMGSLDNQLACIITEAFPQYKLEEIEGWPLDKTLWFLSRAEYVLNQIRSAIMTGGQLDYTQEQESPPQPQQRPVRELPKSRPPEPENKPKRQRGSSIEDDPKFDKALLHPELIPANAIEVGSETSVSDFPELTAINKFMKGKLYPKE